MSIASRITEIETHIGDVYDTINYSYDTTGVNKNIINIPKYLKKGYIDIINNGIDTLYNNFPKVSGIGSNLSLTPTYEAPMKLNEIQGNTLQDGTPTPDTPVEIQSVTGLQNVEVCGKNLINSVAKSGNRLFFNGGTDAGVGTFKAGTYTISYTSQNTITTYIKNTDGTQTNLGTDKAITFTSNKDFDLWLYRSGITVEEVSNIQLEQGSTATDYEPYKGNTYEVNLGKNIWSVGNKNVGWATNYVDVKNILNTLSEGTYSIKLNFKVTEIVKERTDNQYGFSFYNSNGNIGNKKNTNSNINVDDIFICVYTFTISKSQVGNFTQAYFYGFGNGTDNVTARSLMYDCQLEKGSQATSYSPYFTPIELNKIGTYKDRIYKDNGKWYVEKQIGKVVLDGSETGWFKSSTTIIDRFVYELQIGILSNYSNVALSNYFKYDLTTSSLGNIGEFYLYSSGNNTRLFIDYATYNTTTLADFKTWLSTHNTIVYYVLATPTYTEITNTELIEDLESLYTAKSQEGTTNISITSEDLEMILNVSALKGEV